MGTVTTQFAFAFARAAGLRLTEDGRLFEGAELMLRLDTSGGNLPYEDYVTLIDWLRQHRPQRAQLVFNYAEAVDIDNLGALGLAVKTAPTLRDALLRVERYFLLLTDTADYTLDQTSVPHLFIHTVRGEAHPALSLRNECAMAGFGRVFKLLVGEELSYAHVGFRHPAADKAELYEAWFGCPVRFEAPYDGLAIAPPMLDLPMRLGDPAVFRFLTAHLDKEMEALQPAPSFERALAEHISEGLSNGIPKAAAVARAVGVSERTLFRRLAETGLTYQEVLENTQKSLAESLLSESQFSIAEVAFLTGFSEQSTFSRAFKRWAGQTPGAFRKEAQPA